MLLVTMPLSQRTRSEPVTRIQPVLSMGANAALWRSASNPGVSVPEGAGEEDICVHLIIWA